MRARLLRLSEHRTMRPGAQLRVSVRATGYQGTSRTITVTRSGAQVSEYQCLVYGSMNEVTPCDF